jgi:hypothetical protein
MANNELTDAIAVMAVSFGMMLLGFLLYLTCWAVACRYLCRYMAALPDEFQPQPPREIWMILIPVFGMVWAFFVLPGLANKLYDALSARGVVVPGRGARNLAMATCVVNACLILVCLYGVLGPILLVLLILTLIRFHELVAALRQAQAAPPPLPPSAIGSPTP